jgi:hypothetical protein
MARTNPTSAILICQEITAHTRSQRAFESNSKRDPDSLEVHFATDQRSLCTSFGGLGRGAVQSQPHGRGLATCSFRWLILKGVQPCGPQSYMFAISQIYLLTSSNLIFDCVDEQYVYWRLCSRFTPMSGSLLAFSRWAALVPEVAAGRHSTVLNY